MFCIVGDVDPVVPYNFGEMSKGVLTSFCSKVEFKKYPGVGHSSSEQVSLFSLCYNHIFFCKFAVNITQTVFWIVWIVLCN